MCMSLAAVLGHTLFLLSICITGGHYSGSCASDEVTGEIQGETGTICAPRCAQNTFECSIDVPSGTTATPQCMLQNVDQAFFCGLLCQVDSQCPSGASCRKVGTQGVGVCIHPLSFADWAKQATRTKLGIAFPTTAANSDSKGFQIAKAYSALQSLKRRYSISDGDPDVLTVKELLSAMSSTSGLTGSARQALGKFEAFLHKSMRSNSDSGSLGSLGAALSSDMRFFERSLSEGLPGLEHEAESVAWKVEHFQEYGAASALLRGVIEVAIIYLVVGSFYKFQALGATGISMIPHIGFWMEYPALVSDGVKYASQIVAELAGGKSGNFAGSGGSQTLGGSFAERDTFTNFEPSR